MTDLPDFLLARIAERAAMAQECVTWVTHSPTMSGCAGHHDPARDLRRCAADRLIVDAESRWRRPVNGVSAETLRAPDETVAVTWMDEQGRPYQERVSQAEFHERFTEPSPPSDTLKFLALPYADHPDYREEWKP